MTAHVNWETINDAADGRLTAAEQTLVSAHCAGCEACSAQVASLRDMLTVANDLSDHAEPPTAAWEEIRRTVDARKSVAFPGGSHRGGGIQMSTTSIAAAALVLVTLSSAITALVLRPSGSAVSGAERAVTGLATVSATRDIVAMEREYLSTANALRETLDRERSSLSPATIATVERSLQVIDDAIAEAREAFVLDPSNGALRALLRKNHQQKIDFLRRTTTLLQKA